MSRAAVALYTLCLFLLPWSTFPPFPWLHAHAQWSDAVFAVTAFVWALDRWRSAGVPRLRSVHVAMALYLVAAGLSLAHASSAAGAWKLVGMASLVGLAVVGADLAPRPGAMTWISRAVAVTSLLVVAAALTGVILFFLGFPTHLVGTYGDLVPGPYARAQAGLYHPNLLASYCIFAAGVCARSDFLPPRLRRGVLIGLWVSVLLTLSRGILAFVVAALVRRARDLRGRRFALAGAVICIALFAVLTLGNVSLNPVRPFGTRIDLAPSSRLQAAISSWRTFVAQPLLGSGPGTSPGTKDGAPFDAHLTPLNIAATLGLPALVAFLAIPVLLWRDRRRPTDLSLWGALAGIALDGLAQDVEDFRHVWVLFGLVGAEKPSVATAAEGAEISLQRTAPMEPP